MRVIHLILPCAYCGYPPRHDVAHNDDTHTLTCQHDGWTTGPRATHASAIAAWNTHQIATAKRLAERRAQEKRIAA